MSSSVAMHSMGRAGELLLRSPITFLINQEGSQTTIAVPEFEIIVQASTEPEAIADAHDRLKDLYEDLTAQDESGLGDTPLRWKRVLDSLVILQTGAEDRTLSHSGIEADRTR